MAITSMLDLMCAVAAVVILTSCCGALSAPRETAFCDILDHTQHC